MLKKYTIDQKFAEAVKKIMRQSMGKIEVHPDWDDEPTVEIDVPLKCTCMAEYTGLHIHNDDCPKFVRPGSRNARRN